jgi:Xaa-Pro aminopeptidase
MDVHDVGDYKVDGEWRELEPGMCLTIEPGLYIPAADDVPAHLHDIGVRIEDDVHITKDGAENLTDGLPKAADDIEAMMRG